MHILLGLLGSIVTILWLLHQLGIDLGGMNPFGWRRRRAWRNKFEANPIFALEDPREIAAVLIAGVAKIDGDLSADEKRGLLAELEETLSMSPKAASELLSSTVFLLGDMHVVNAQLDELLARYREHLAADQIESLLEIAGRVAALDGGPTARQDELIAAIRQGFGSEAEPQGTWG